jgi:hypothetical protein
MASPVPSTFAVKVTSPRLVPLTVTLVTGAVENLTIAVLLEKEPVGTFLSSNRDY